MAITAALAENPNTDTLSDDAFQDYLLQGVSRTFALTIPQLPPDLGRVVSNAYLLCRIVDTIEDEPALDATQKRRFCDQFVQVVEGSAPSSRFSSELHPLLSDSTLATERELIRETPRVIGITHEFNAVQREALETCVRIMASGMAEFQEHNDRRGLPHLGEMDRYCYHVAGVVGEMLTKLFCDYSPEIAAHRDALMKLSVSFGQGLQMTNILKDVWDDRQRGACWLPQDVFSASGFDLGDLAPGRYREGFGAGLTQLIAVAHAHLKNAFDYTLLIPPHETGIRNFCLWAIGMAVLTLRKINKHKDFASGQQVKISRRSVKATIIAARLTASHDPLLRSLFYLAGRGLPSLQAPVRSAA
jgi:farnesyl-diphosphate farnesyltransferase